MGVPSSLGPTVGDSRKAGEQVQLGFLLFSVPLPACWAIWFLPPLPRVCGGFSLPTTPKTVTPLSFPGQVGDAGFRKIGAVDSGRTLGGDPKGLGVTVGRPPDMQPHPASRMQRHACTVLESGSSPGGLSGHRVKSKQPSLPLSQGGLEWGPEAPHTHTLARISLPWALPLLLFRLPNYQAEVAVWFALFLYVKYPHSPISHVHYWLGHCSFPLSATPPPTCHRKQVRSGVSGLRWEVGTHPCLVPLSDPQFAPQKWVYWAAAKD